MEVPLPLDKYLDAFKKTCSQVHSLINSTQYHPYPRLQKVVASLDGTCMTTELALSSLLQSMGARREWEATFGDYDPLSLNRTEMHLMTKYRKKVEAEWNRKMGQQIAEMAGVLRPITMIPETTTRRFPRPGKTRHHSGRLMKDSDGETTPEPDADYHRVDDAKYPEYLTDKYRKLSRQHERPGSVCSPSQLFDYPYFESLHQFVRAKVCVTFYLPEGRDFFGEEAAGEFARTESISKIREAYKSAKSPTPELLMEMESSGVYEKVDDVGAQDNRNRRQVGVLALGAGVLLESVAANVASWLGFGTDEEGRKEEVEAVNENTAHLEKVAAHVGLIEAMEKRLRVQTLKMMSDEERISITMELQASTNAFLVQMFRVINGLEVLFHDGHLSPLLVDARNLYTAVKKLEIKAGKNHELLLIENYADVWTQDISYYLMKNFSLTAVAHIPTGKAESRHQLFEYVPTPLRLTGDESSNISFLALSGDPWIAHNPVTGLETVMTEHELSNCPRVSARTRFCPRHGYSYKVQVPTCLSALWKGVSEAVMARCPIVEFRNTPFIAQIDLHSFVVNTPSPVSARVMCGLSQVAMPRTMNGLEEVQLKDGCRLVADQFTLEPVPGMTVRDSGHQAVELTMENQTLVEALEWARGTKLLNHYSESAAPTMTEIMTTWDHHRLTYHRHLTLYQIIMYTGVGIVTVLVLYLVIKVVLSRRKSKRKETEEIEMEQRLLNIEHIEETELNNLRVRHANRTQPTGPRDAASVLKERKESRKRKKTGGNTMDAPTVPAVSAPSADADAKGLPGYSSP